MTKIVILRVLIVLAVYYNSIYRALLVLLLVAVQVPEYPVVYSVLEVQVYSTL
jgi:hypothetical protein